MFSGTIRGVECHLGAAIEDLTHNDAVLLVLSGQSDDTLKQMFTHQ